MSIQGIFNNHISSDVVYPGKTHNAENQFLSILIPPGMTNKRIDTISGIIKALPQRIYKALIDPAAIEKWRAPEGMRCVIYEFDPQPGGIYRIALEYTGPHVTAGKSSKDKDVVKGRFLEMVPDSYVVEEVEFSSTDPAFNGLMKIKTTVEKVPEGASVTFVCTNVPTGIKKADHEKGLSSTLENLRRFLEQSEINRSEVP